MNAGVPRTGSRKKNFLRAGDHTRGTGFAMLHSDHTLKELTQPHCFLTQLEEICNQSLRSSLKYPKGMDKLILPPVARAPAFNLWEEIGAYVQVPCCGPSPYVGLVAEAVRNVHGL